VKVLRAFTPSGLPACHRQRAALHRTLRRFALRLAALSSALTCGISARDFFTIGLDLGGIIEHANMLHRGANKGGHAMNRRKSRRSQAWELLLAAMHAEDEAVACVHELDPAVALATACSVEETLAIIWEVEQEEMRRRRDPRKVMCITDRHRRELRCALASVPHGVQPDPVAEREALCILKELPPDRAWWVSRTVVRYVEFRFRCSKPSSGDRKSDQNTDMDDIRHAAARL
jgi:hypothetical protein